MCYSSVFLPMTLKGYPSPGPDLIVESMIVTPNSIQVTIKNQGNVPVNNWLWIDAYINPSPPPTAVHQLWETLASQGVVWEIPFGSLYLLGPGGRITLTVGDVYYRPARSKISWPLPAGAQVYAQVDSGGASPTYGDVLENHEIVGGPYNNVYGPVTP